MSFLQYTHLEREYKYFHSVVYDVKPKTVVFLLLSRKHIPLGKVKWYGPWRQYCFYPEPETVFSRGCLKDIQDYIEFLMNTRKTREASP